MAARLMAKREKGFRFYAADHVHPWRDITPLIMTLCASALSQDEMRGQAKKRRGRK